MKGLSGLRPKRGELAILSEVFVEAAAIKSRSFLGGRSFMSKGPIDSYSYKQVADLLSHIKTLK